jgi:hypothetical protein
LRPFLFFFYKSERRKSVGAFGDTLGGGQPVGRVLTEKKEAEQHLAHLHAEAKRLGEILESLGKGLKERPDIVRFERQAVNVKYSTRDQRLFQVEEIDGSTIMKLTAEIKGHDGKN